MGSRATLLRAISGLGGHAQTNPLQYVRWTPPQLALLRCEDKRVLLRTGNQIGKTWALCGELLYRALGSHPYKTIPQAPVQITLVTGSWKQSVAVQSKLWELAPKDEVHPDTEFDPVRGFRGVHPALRFKNGSILRVKTSKQGGLSLAGETVDVVGIDEPVAQPRVYAELERRLTRTGGRLFLTMTPVNAPIEWVRELAEAKKLTDLHFPMSPEVFIPEGCTEPLRTNDGTPMDSAWIEEQRAAVLPWEAPVVLDGEWEMRATGKIFSAFQDMVHVVPNLLHSDVRPHGDVQICLGIDYGETKLRTVAVLVYVDDTGKHPKVYVVGEYVPHQASTLDMDAQGILAMLAARGDQWSDLDFAWGDKKYSDRAGRITKKSNGMMLAAIEQTLKVDRGLRPRIHGAKKGQGAGRGSVWRGVRWLHDTMIRPGHLFIDESCERLIWSLHNWDGTEQHSAKDAVDALRYSLRHLILPARKFQPRHLLRKF